MERKLNLIMFGCMILLIHNAISSISPNKQLEKMATSITTLQKSVDTLQPKSETTKLPKESNSNPAQIAVSNHCQAELNTLVQTRDDFFQKCDEQFSDACKIQGIILNTTISTYLSCLNPN